MGHVEQDQRDIVTARALVERVTEERDSPVKSYDADSGCFEALVGLVARAREFKECHDAAVAAVDDPIASHYTQVALAMASEELMIFAGVMPEDQRTDFMGDAPTGDHRAIGDEPTGEHGAVL